MRRPSPRHSGGVGIHIEVGSISDGIVLAIGFLVLLLIGGLPGYALKTTRAAATVKVAAFVGAGFAVLVMVLLYRDRNATDVAAFNVFFDLMLVPIGVAAVLGVLGRGYREHRRTLHARPDVSA
jgi:hypothetical protein